MRLLICDDHESHITGGFIEHCIHNDIILMILPPHSSHYMQPLDLAIFSRLKTAMSVELGHIICTGISRVHKAEWLTAYIKTRITAFSAANIHSSWTTAGLFPFNPSKVLDRCIKPLDTPTTNRSSTPNNMLPFENPLLTSSPANVTVLRNANMALNTLITTNQPLPTPARKYVVKLTKSSERLFA